MPAPTNPYQPYAAQHTNITGPGDDRPTCMQVLRDADKLGALKGKVILITGCSSGIGVETARALYETGATLYLTARDMPKLAKVIDDIVANAQHNRTGPHPQAIEMHLDKLASVRQGAAEFRAASGGKINILIANAAVMRCPFTRTDDGFEMQIGTNHFAHFLLFQLLKDDLIATAAASGTTSRVVAVSSYGHRFSEVKFADRAELDRWNAGEGYEDSEAYGSSKTANIYMANSITRHYGHQNLLATSLHPGSILTELVRHMSEAHWERVWKQTEGSNVFKSPDQGAATTVWAAVSDYFEGKNGGVYLSNVGEAQLEAPSEKWHLLNPGYYSFAYDEVKEERLWNLSCEVLGVSAK